MQRPRGKKEIGRFKREQRPTGEKREWSRDRGEKRVKQRLGRDSTGSGISLTALNHSTNSWTDFGSLKSHGGNDSTLFICSFQRAEDGYVCSVHVRLFVTHWTIAHQGPLSIGLF